METKIIAFCGIDASGKTTSINAISDILRTKGFSVYCKKPVDMTHPLLKEVAIAMSKYSNEYGDFPADHLATILALELIKTNLEIIEMIKTNAYEFIILDRWFYSHIAYARTYDIDKRLLNKLLEGCVDPDIVFLLDAPIDIIMGRLKTRGTSGINENFNIIQKTQKHFRELADEYQFYIIDTEMNNMEDTQKLIIEYLLGSVK